MKTRFLYPAFHLGVEPEHDRRTDRQTDRQIDRQIDKQDKTMKDQQTSRETELAAGVEDRLRN